MKMGFPLFLSIFFTTIYTMDSSKKSLDVWENTFVNAIYYKREKKMHEAEKLFALLSQQEHYLAIPATLSLANIYMQCDKCKEAKTLLLNALDRVGNSDLGLAHIAKKGLIELTYKDMLQQAISHINNSNPVLAEQLLIQLVQQNESQEIKNRAMFYYNTKLHPIIKIHPKKSNCINPFDSKNNAHSIFGK